MLVPVVTKSRLCGHEQTDTERCQKHRTDVVPRRRLIYSDLPRYSPKWNLSSFHSKALASRAWCTHLRGPSTWFEQNIHMPGYIQFKCGLPLQASLQPNQHISRLYSLLHSANIASHRPHNHRLQRSTSSPLDPAIEEPVAYPGSLSSALKLDQFFSLRFYHDNTRRSSRSTDYQTMKLLCSLLAIAVSVNAMTARLDGCNDEPLSVAPWMNCKGNPCSQFSCLQACGRAGSSDKASDFVMIGNYNGPILKSCSCICYRK